MDVTKGCEVHGGTRLQYRFSWALACSATACCRCPPISIQAKITKRTWKWEARWNIKHKTNKGAVFMRQNSNLQHRLNTELRKMSVFVYWLVWAVGVLKEKWARLAMQKHFLFRLCRIAKQHHGRTKGWIKRRRRREWYFKDETSIFFSGTLSTKTNKHINFAWGTTVSATWGKKSAPLPKDKSVLSLNVPKCTSYLAKTLL